MRDFCLLDFFVWKLHLEYLSDLKTLSSVQKNRLLDIIGTLKGYDEFFPSEWLDACEYLTGKRTENAEDAKITLQDYLCAARRTEES